MAFSFYHGTPATGAVAMYETKEILKAAGWSVRKSGDGLAIYSAVGDIITSGAAGANGLGNTRAWFEIEDPLGAQAYTIQRGTSGYLWRVKLSRTTTFSGGAPDFQTTPSSADEQFIRGAGTDAAPTYEAIFNNIDGSYRWNFGADAAAPYNFWGAGFPIGGGTVNAFMARDFLTDLQGSDADPYAHVMETAEPSYVYLANTSAFFAFLASAAPATWVNMPACYISNSAGIVFPNGASTNPVDANDDSAPVIYARRIGTSSGYKGVGTLYRYGGTTRTNGDTGTKSTARDRIRMGDIWLPWDGTIPTI